MQFSVIYDLLINYQLIGLMLKRVHLLLVANYQLIGLMLKRVHLLLVANLPEKENLQL